MWPLILLSVIDISLSQTIHYPQEVHLANVKQLTFGGANAEAYFSFDNKKIVFQVSSFSFINHSC